MPRLLADLEAFLAEHRRCGRLDSGVEDGWVWMACECGGYLRRRYCCHGNGSASG